MAFSRRWILGLVCLALLSAGGAVLWMRSSHARAKTLQDGTRIYFRPPTVIEAFVQFPKPRELSLDGEALLMVAAEPGPLVVHSRLMILTVTGPAELKITAYAKKAGEEVDVLKGRVVVRKAYPSGNSTPEALAAGDMVMVNREIDLMEKERSDARAVAAWAARLKADSGD